MTVVSQGEANLLHRLSVRWTSRNTHAHAQTHTHSQSSAHSSGNVSLSGHICSSAAEKKARTRAVSVFFLSLSSHVSSPAHPPSLVPSFLSSLPPHYGLFLSLIFSPSLDTSASLKIHNLVFHPQCILQDRRVCVRGGPFVVSLLWIDTSFLVFFFFFPRDKHPIWKQWLPASLLFIQPDITQPFTKTPSSPLVLT